MAPRSPTPESALFMLAGDLMSSPAVAASAADPVSSVARLMLEAGINGVPLLDAAGVPVGMVSDGDLMGRRGDHRREWWLEILAQAASPDAGFSRESLDRPVHEVMTSPLITVAHTAPVQLIAEALQAHRVKRLPVLNEGRLIGVVSRADLLRVVESVPLARLAAGERRRRPSRLPRIADRGCFAARRTGATRAAAQRGKAGAQHSVSGGFPRGGPRPQG